MDTETLSAILGGLVRVGTVTWTDESERVARVTFRDTGLPSGPLYVLASRPYIPDYKGEQRTEYESGGSGYAEFQRHEHDLDIKPWMPLLDATVLCLYLPMFDADGFILGEIGALGKIKQYGG